ncbi:MAG: HDOD domain-containing protein [Lysinibacillus sp.]
MDIFLGRQPIFDLDEQVIAYELLYRNTETNSFPQVDSDRATLDVLISAFVTIGVEEVAGGRPCFINFTENLLLGKLPEYLEPSKIVIEILEDVNITSQLVERIKELSLHGYKIALDDFILQPKYTELYDELFQYVNYIKIDFLMTSALERMQLEDRIKTFYPHIRLLAEKVETHQQFQVALQSGYSLFQGYFFEKPQILKAKDIPANALQYFHIVALLREDEPDINHIAESIEVDISLSYKLLQIVNMSPKRKRSKIRSIKQAVLMVGLAELRKWVYLLALRELPQHATEDIYKQLMESSLYRAKVCERLAKQNFLSNSSEHSLVGLFSLIDTLLRTPMHEILGQLPLSQEIVATLSNNETSLTPYLKLSIAMDKADFQKIEQYATQLSISTEVVHNIHKEVQAWVKETFEELEE